MRALANVDSARVLPPVCVNLATLPYSVRSGVTHGLRGDDGGAGVLVFDTSPDFEGGSS